MIITPLKILHSSFKVLKRRAFICGFLDAARPYAAEAATARPISLQSV